MTESSTPHIGQLLRDAFARFEDELLSSMPPFDGHAMRPVHNHVLRHLDLDGTRASVIAERSGLTRQAITQIVDELEDAGVVTRVPDPADGRAKQIVYTEAGRRAFAGSRERIRDLEERWRDEIGADRWDAVVASLREITGLRERPGIP